MIVIAEKGGKKHLLRKVVKKHLLSMEFIHFICNGDDERKTINRCFHDSLVKSHAAFKSHFSNMRFLTDV